MLATLHVQFSRVSDLERPDHLVTNPAVPVEGYRDSFGNWCNRLVAPAGRFTLETDANAVQHQVQHLPAKTLQFLLGSRYCETDVLSEEAWRLFKNMPLGWPRVQAICDFVHNHLAFGYEHARPTRTAAEALPSGAAFAGILPTSRPPFAAALLLDHPAPHRHEGR
jgi:transglutaminase-like putative cysteine protease